MRDFISPYLQGLSASARPRQCYYCGNYFADPAHHRRERRTKDHILAKAHGRIEPHFAVNHRPCCEQCNRLRATLGHCCGALMLAIIEGGYRNLDYVDMAGKLGMKPQGGRVKWMQRRQRRREHQRQRARAAA